MGLKALAVRPAARQSLFFLAIEKKEKKEKKTIEKKYGEEYSRLGLAYLREKNNRAPKATILRMRATYSHRVRACSFFYK